MIKDLLERVSRGDRLSRSEMAAMIDALVDGSATDAQMAGLLVGLRVRGETVDELVGAAQALGARAIKLLLDRPADLDTCGTGGDGSASLNFSTAAALIAAASGLRVAKHGNRSISSRCGSADVLEELGIPIALDPVDAAAAIQTRQFAFLLAPNYHPATAAIGRVRRALGIRSLFNLVGPLTNPADVTTQLVGVYAPDRAPLMAEALRALGCRKALVVASESGLDEIAPWGRTTIVELSQGELRHYDIGAEDFGLAPTGPESIRGGDARTNAKALTAILSGQPHPGRTAVLMNGSAALVAAGTVENFRDGTERVIALIESGAVLAKLEQLRQRVTGAAA